MIKILKGQEDAVRGLIVCEELGNASSLPLVVHFLSAASSPNQKVAIVTSKFTETNYKLICSKAGVRWIPSQINFFEFIQPFGSFDYTADQIMDDLYKKVSESTASVVLFDDLTVLEQFGATPVEVAVFVHKIFSNMKISSPETALLLASFSVPSTATALLRHKCCVFAQMTPVGHGFGKDASAKALLTIKSPSTPTTKKGILISGERTINGSWVSVDY